MLVEVSVRGRCLRLGLVQLGFGLQYRGHVGVIGSLLGIEVLLGHDACFVKALCAFLIELFLLKVGLGMCNVGFSGLFSGNVRRDIGTERPRWLPSVPQHSAEAVHSRSVAIT